MKTLVVRARFSELLTKQMDRKAFLVHVGAGFVLLSGISAMLLAFTGTQKRTHVKGPSAAGYGGKKSSKANV